MPDPTESAAGFSRDLLHEYASSEVWLRNQSGGMADIGTALATYCLLLMDDKKVLTRYSLKWRSERDAERAAHDKTAEALGAAEVPLAHVVEKHGGCRCGTHVQAYGEGGPLEQARTALAAYEEMRKETKEKA